MRHFQVDNQAISFLHSAEIKDEHGKVVFETHSTIGFITPQWIINKAGHEVARIHRTLGLTPTWQVDGSLGSFCLRQKIFAVTRDLIVEGGKFSGYELAGSLLDRDFEITKDERILCKASGSLVSLYDHHSIEVLSDDPDDALMSVIGMVVVHADHTQHQH